MPTFNSYPATKVAGETTVEDDKGWEWIWNGVAWESNGFVQAYDPLAGFAGPFTTAATLPAANAASWVSPGNGASRFWGTVPDSAGEPIMYTETNAATTGGWWTVMENYNTTSATYSAGYCSIILPNVSGSPTEHATGTGGTLTFNPTPSFSEIDKLEYYYDTDTLAAQGRTSSSTSYLSWNRYNRYNISGADSTQKSLQGNSTASINFESGFGSGGSGTVPDKGSVGNSSIFAASNRIVMEFGTNMTNTDLGTELANTNWELRRGDTVLGEWFFANGSGTQVSNDSNDGTSNHRRVRLYDVYYKKTN